MEEGKGACKSDHITATPMRTAVTPNNKQQNECEQEAPKKPRSAMKKGLKNYFGQGKRSPLPSTAGNPIATVLQRREVQGGTPTGKGDSRAGAEGKKGNTNSWHTPIAKKGNKNKNSPQGASNEVGRNNKKLRSDDKESAGEKSNKNKSEKEKEQAGFAVDLKSMSTSMKKKSPKTKSAR
jgi:hypothetical protein